MASEIVTKLVVESREYESKIDRARSGLLHMEEACRKVDGTLAVLEKEEKQFVESLGKMQTVSKTTQGRIGELTKAFTDLSAQYNRLTQEEKNGDFGKALKSSLDQLRTRIIDSKNELKGIQGEIQPTSSLFEQLSSKLGVNIGQLGAWGVALGAGKVALDVMKDSFLSSESNIDAWGRTVESTTSLYDSFCLHLNNNSLDSFFANIQRVKDSAREAYDAMDLLNTKMTILNPERARVQSMIDKQKEIIKKSGKDSAEGKAAQAEIKRLEPSLKSAYKEEAKLNFDAFRKEVDKKLADARISLDKNSKSLLMRSFSDSSAYDKIVAGARTEQRGTGRFSVAEDGGVGPEITETWKNTNQKLLDLFTDDWRSKYSSYLSAGYQAQSASYGVGIADARYTSDGKGGSTSTTPTKEEPILPEGSIAELTKQINDYREQQNLATNNNDWQTLQTNIDATQAKIDEIVGKVKEIKPDPTALSADWFKSMQIDTSDMAMGTQQFFDAQQINADWQMLQDSLDGTPLTLGVDITEEEWTDFLTRINEKLAELGIAPINIPINAKPVEEAGKVALTAEQHAQGAAKAFSAIGNALSQIDDPGAKVAGLVATAIGNIAATFAASLKGTMTPWDWIAGAVSGAATMITTIAAIKSATAGAYADGGVIGGNSYVGDRLYARVNSGETILNQDQAQRALDMMDGSPVVGGSGGNSTISGEQIVTVINAYGRRTGRGEILQ